MVGFGPTYVMSIAPAYRASMADGPALKLFHSIFTPGPSALSNQPLAFPAMPWGWVMFGNTPTRTTVGFCALAINESAAKNTNTRRAQLFIFCPRLLPMDYERQNTRLLFGFLLFALAALFVLAVDDVSQRGVFEDWG